MRNILELIELVIKEKQMYQKMYEREHQKVKKAHQILVSKKITELSKEELGKLHYNLERAFEGCIYEEEFLK